MKLNQSDMPQDRDQDEDELELVLPMPETDPTYEIELELPAAEELPAVETEMPEGSDSTALNSDNEDAPVEWPKDHGNDGPSGDSVVDEHGQQAEDSDFDVSTDFDSLIGRPESRMGSRRPEKSFLAKTLPPIFGGLAAFPIATAIMWYGLGQDIGTTGPTVAKYVPWIVPSHLRGDQSYRGNQNFSADGRSRFSNENSNSAFQTDLESEIGGSVRSELPRLSQRPDATETTTNPPSSLPKVSSPEASSETTSSASIRSLLQSLEEMIEEWDSTPKEREAQLLAVSKFYGLSCELSKHVSQLDEKRLRVWDRELATFAKGILASEKFSKVIRRCSSGELPGLIAEYSSEYAAMIEEIVITEETEGDLTWKAMINGKQSQVKMPIHLTRRQSTSDNHPIRCFLFLKLDETIEPGVWVATACY